MQRTKKAASQAITVWNSTIKSAAFAPPSSLFTVAIAATHGVYKRVKIKKTKAVCGVNTELRAAVSPEVVKSEAKRS